MSKLREEYFDYVLKLILIGDSGVGKTAVVLRYTDDVFVHRTVSSTGIDFRVKTREINGSRVKIQVWDTAGQERYRTITSHFFRGAHGVMVFYDITHRHSFENIPQWIHFAKSHTPDDVKIMLIGNKSDKEAKRRIDVKSGEDMARIYNIPFYETSAGTNHNLEEAFDTLVMQIMGSVEEQRTDPSITLQSKPTNDSCC